METPREAQLRELVDLLDKASQLRAMEVEPSEALLARIAELREATRPGRADIPPPRHSGPLSIELGP